MGDERRGGRPVTVTGVTFTLEQVRYDSPDAHMLIEELQEEYVIRYGGRDETPVDPDDFAPPKGTFLLAYRDAQLVGCAGMRRRSDGGRRGEADVHPPQPTVDAATRVTCWRWWRRRRAPWGSPGS